MAKFLEIEVTGYSDTINNMTINGKKPKVTKTKNSRIYKIETDKEEAEVVIFQAHPYYGKNWFWWELLFFIVSVFGIFDTRLDKRCQVIDSRFNIPLKEETTKINMKPLNFVDGGKFIEYESASPVNEISNVRFLDKGAQEKHKKMKKAKLGIFLGIAIITVLLIILI